MTKTTYVFRNGELVEKRRPEPIEFQPLRFDIPDLDVSDLIDAYRAEWERQHLNEFTPAHIDHLTNKEIVDLIQVSSRRRP